MRRVDVIVPCYNYGAFLPDCVGSVLGQRGVEARVLIIDDASTDGSAAVGERLARADGRVEFRAHEKNRGHIATYNEGLEWAAGDYLLLLSADDALPPGALARAAQVMEANPDVGLTYGPQRGFQGRVPEEDECCPAGPLEWKKLTYREVLEQCSLGGPPIGAATMVVRTSLQKKVGGYRPDLPHGGGIEMRLRLAYHAPVGYIPVVQGYARRHEGSMTANSALARRVAQHFAAFDTHFSEYGVPSAGGKGFREGFYRGLHKQAFWEAYNAFERGNVADCKECLAFALAKEPGLRGERAYSRLRWKMLLGPRAWSLLRPLTKLLPR